MSPFATSLTLLIGGIGLAVVGLAGLGFCVMRAVWGAIGAVLGVVCGSIYAGIMWLLNGHRSEPIGMSLAPDEPVIHAKISRRSRLVPVGAAAITFGRRIYCRSRFPSTSLVRHELVHVEQYSRWGFFGFLARYGRDVALHGYRGSEIEHEAYSRQ